MYSSQKMTKLHSKMYHLKQLNNINIFMVLFLNVQESVFMAKNEKQTYDGYVCIRLILYPYIFLRR